MKTQLTNIKKDFKKDILSIADSCTLSAVKVKYMGKKGLVTALLKDLKDVPKAEKPELGKLINELKKSIQNDLDERQKEFGANDSKKNKDTFDYTLPGKSGSLGSKHPITLVIDEITRVFERLGFSARYGKEIETDFYNFEALNIPKDHPARDMQDTFYITEDKLLRTHTSPVQIHVMKDEEPPLRIIAPGKVYRRDSDITHTPMFHQIEGFMVDKDISFSHLKGILEIFIHNIFDKNTPIRFRPSYFPFTEPSAEIDIGCVICQGKKSGCRVCSSTGWLEILGAGMIDPAVFAHVNYDPEKWTGFAFGLGIERIAMLKYNIHDIRLFFENDIRFLRQFY